MDKGPEQTFSQRRHADVYQVHEKVLRTVITKEMQIKNTMTYNFIPVRLDVIKKSKDNTHW